MIAAGLLLAALAYVLAVAFEHVMRPVRDYLLNRPRGEYPAPIKIRAKLWTATIMAVLWLPAAAGAGVLLMGGMLAL